jgi:prephenate dehydrogenase
MSPTPNEPHFRRVAISGVGLLGGSLGMAVRQRGLAEHVVGIGRDTRRLARAAEMGALDSYTLDLAEGCSQADLIVLCGPISSILDQLPIAFTAAPAGALITDVGSTKRSIVQRAAKLTREGVFFVGSHPMAGSEKSGVGSARADLYESATVILTPEISTPDHALDTVRAFWVALGMHVVEILPARHDQVLAHVSHLPHMVATALVGLTERGPRVGADVLRAVAGPGFRDTTRIAMGNPPMWLDIFLDNRKAMLEAMDGLMDYLREVRTTLQDSDREALRDLLEHAAELRGTYERKPKETQEGAKAEG